MIAAAGMVMLPVRHITGRRRYRRLQAMNIETEREDDGRWIAEVPDLPGVMVYGGSREEAISKVKALALRVLADRLEHGESIPELGEVFAVPA
jgi:predicted RNase H-like HicB family nuclease